MPKDLHKDDSRRVTICVSVDELAAGSALDAWFTKWRDALSFVSENEGCGCCVDMYRVEGPATAIAELPERLIATDPTWF